RRIGAIAGVLATALLAWACFHVEHDWGRAAYDRIGAALVAEGWTRADAILQFGPAPQGLIVPVGWYLPGHPAARKAASSTCSKKPRESLFVISYDAIAGPAWLRRHAREIVAERGFTAYDHSPRGP